MFYVDMDRYEFSEDGTKLVLKGEVKDETAPVADLSTLTVKELRALAADKGIEVPSEAKKAELVAALS